MRRALLVILLAACSSAPKPATPPAAPPSKCANVADHLLTLMSDTAQQAPTEQLDAMRKTFFEHCRDDAWSMQAQDCFLTVKTREDAAKQCEQLLTPAQEQSLMGSGS